MKKRIDSLETENKQLKNLCQNLQHEPNKLKQKIEGLEHKLFKSQRAYNEILAQTKELIDKYDRDIKRLKAELKEVADYKEYLRLKKLFGDEKD